jgi:hypothetical protein
MTPEVSLREDWRKTLPKGSFLTLIESTVTGVPDAFLQLPLVCQYPYNASPIVIHESQGLWIEFKVPPYKVSDDQINWWIRYIRAGGHGGVIAPYSSPNKAQSTHLHAARATPLVVALHPKTSKALTGRSAAGQIGYWPMDRWTPQQIEQINTFIRTGEHGIEWSDWLGR